MGWLYNKIPASQSVEEYLRDVFSEENEFMKYEVVDCFMDGLTVAHLAQRITRKASGKSIVMGVVCLLDFEHGEEENQLGYKDISETDGPGRLCPKRVLRQLSPLPEFKSVFKSIVPGSLGYQRAMQWREASWREINSRAAYRAKIAA